MKNVLITCSAMLHLIAGSDLNHFFHIILWAIPVQAYRGTISHKAFFPSFPPKCSLHKTLQHGVPNCRHRCSTAEDFIPDEITLNETKFQVGEFEQRDNEVKDLLSKFNKVSDEHWGIDPRLFSSNGAMTLFERRHQLNEGLELLEGMKNEGVKPDINTYESLMALCQKSGHNKRVIELMDEIETNDLEPNINVYETLIKAYSQERRIMDMMYVIEQMRMKGLVPSVDTYLIILRVLSQHPQNLQEYKTVIEEFMELYPSIYLPELHEMRAELWQRLHKYESILQYWKTHVSHLGQCPTLLTCEITLRASLKMQDFHLFDTLDDNIHDMLPSETTVYLTPIRVDRFLKEQRWTEVLTLLESYHKVQGQASVKLLHKMLQQMIKFGENSKCLAVVNGMENFGFHPSTKTLNLMLENSISSQQYKEALDNYRKMKTKNLNIQSDELTIQHLLVASWHLNMYPTAIDVKRQASKRKIKFTPLAKRIIRAFETGQRLAESPQQALPRDD